MISNKPKTILLVGTDEDQIGVLSFILSHTQDGMSHNRFYSVAKAHSTSEAVTALRDGKWDVMIVVSPIAKLQPLLDKAHELDSYMSALVLTEAPPREGRKYVDHILYKPSMAYLIERIGMVTQRARGPRKGSPAALRCGEKMRQLKRERSDKGLFLPLEAA